MKARRRHESAPAATHRFRMKPAFVAAVLLLSCAALAACGGDGGAGGGGATATPERPGPEDVLGEWVRTNRNVDFVGDCSNAREGLDVGKLCSAQIGKRGTRYAYALGPTFSESTALAILNEGDEGWTVVSVNNRDPSAPEVPGIPWPLQVGDAVVVIGLGEGDCLRIREQPTQEGKQLQCMPDGSTAIIQEGPVDAETFTWWRIAGEGFNGWAAGTWLRLQDAIAELFAPPTVTPEP
jgi:hypothetical protein